MNSQPRQPQGQQSSHQNPNPSPWITWLGGIGFTLIVAAIGYGIAQIPGLSLIGPMACAIILAVVYRQVFGYPEVVRAGIVFAKKKLLRYAIVLFGLQLNVDAILHQGLPLLLRGAFVIILAVGLTMLIAKWLHADMSLSFLASIGTGICGASAIASVSPIVKAKSEDTALSVAIISLIGTGFGIIYTLIRPILPLTGLDYGVWSGISLHEIANVVLAAAPAGDDPLATAMLSKLGRVLLLIPLSFILVFWMKRKAKGSESEANISFPWFLVGFIIMSLIGSYVIGNLIQIPDSILTFIKNLSTFLLTMAMVGFGLDIALKTLRTKASRPLLSVLITSVVLSFVTYFIL